MSTIKFKESKKLTEDQQHEQHKKAFIEFTQKIQHIEGYEKCEGCGKIHNATLDNFNSGLIVSCFGHNGLVLGNGNLGKLAETFAEWVVREPKIFHTFMGAIMIKSSEYGLAHKVDINEL